MTAFDILRHDELIAIWCSVYYYVWNRRIILLVWNLTSIQYFKTLTSL